MWLPWIGCLECTVTRFPHCIMRCFWIVYNIFFPWFRTHFPGQINGVPGEEDIGVREGRTQLLRTASWRLLCMVESLQWAHHCCLQPKTSDIITPRIFSVKPRQSKSGYAVREEIWNSVIHNETDSPKC